MRLPGLLPFLETEILVVGRGKAVERDFLEFPEK